MEKSEGNSLPAMLKGWSEYVRENLTAPLLAACLGLWAYSEGTAAAIYMFAAAVLCLGVVRYRKLSDKLTGLERLFQNFKTDTGARIDGLTAQADSAKLRLKECEDAISKLDGELLDLRERIPLEVPSKVPRLLVSLLCAVLFVNIGVFTFFRNQLLELGQNMGDLIAQVATSKELSERAISIVESGRSAARTQSRRKTEEIGEIAEGRAMPRPPPALPSVAETPAVPGVQSPVAVPASPVASPVPPSPSPPILKQKGRERSGAAGRTPHARVTFSETPSENRSGVYEIKPDQVIESDGGKAKYSISGMRVIQKRPPESPAPTHQGKPIDRTETPIASPVPAIP